MKLIEKYSGVLAMIAIVIALLVWIFPTSVQKTIVQQLGGTTNYDDLVLSGTLTTGGAVTLGDDATISGDVITVNGIDTTYCIDTPTASSANLCSCATPSATSTLVAATLRIKNTTGTNTFQVGQAYTATATTTLLGSLTLATGLYGELVATTTATALTDTVVVPNSYINWKVATGSAGSITFDGQCVAVFREM